MYNILVIEDNDTMREGMVQILKKLQLSVSAASNGKDGLDMAMQNSVDVVVSDYRLPKKNGIEILEQIKAKLPNTEVLIITAFGSIELAVEAIQKGAADFITKPFSPDELRDKVRKLLGPE